MFDRNCYDHFQQWADKPSRKPLVIRGARQVGKTSAVIHFAQSYFDELIYLNLEKKEACAVFSEIAEISQLIVAIELHTQKKIIPGKTLLFIDEIQNSAHAMTQLRYLYEEMPALHVIAAGSLLEVATKDKGFSFPVGRVEFCYMAPVRFDEFIKALGYHQSAAFLSQQKLYDSIPESIHNTLNKQFREYVAIGGMPEAVQVYSESKSPLDIVPVYESLLTGFLDDVYKYSTTAKAPYLQHVIEHAPRYAGKAVAYEKFAGSSYRSREMSETFSTLEKAFLLRRVYPSSAVSPPLENNYRRRPKLLFLDVGLVCYTLGAVQAVLSTTELIDTFQGQIAEQVVGQTLSSRSFSQKSVLSYWLRDKKGVSAEVDYLLPFNDMIIPIEVKSGRSGKLRSLWEYVERSTLSFAVRIYSGPLQIDTIKTRSGKPFQLVSIPFYLTHRVGELLEEI
jgi:predicted AAA+ superfamily ATPase